MTRPTRPRLRRRSRSGDVDVARADRRAPASVAVPDERPPVAIRDDDPLLGYLLATHGAVDVDALELDSPALRELRVAGVKLMVPLASQGELIGVLHLGPRLSEQEYSSDDRKLLADLAAQVAPALRVGQLVRQQEAGAALRQRIEQELEVARLIQQHFLPKELPALDGWELAALYRPAREVGGDFYDVIPLPDGRWGLLVGDVTDKGVPAALVMSATRSLLRAAAQRLVEPGEVLARVNDQLVPDMPAKMFVTCLYGVLDPASGRLRFANAGHDVPYVKTAHGVEELRARGMPLGLMPLMAYEEKETVLALGDSVLLHSDGIVECHDPARGMFGFPRLKDVVAQATAGEDLIARVLAEVAAFTGPDAEQEDDITMVVLHRTSGEPDGRVLADLTLESRPGGEREAIAAVERAIAGVGLTPARVERLKTAVGEATMNAMEHGSAFRADRPVRLRVLREPGHVAVRVTDAGEAPPPGVREVPDIEAKLDGRQRPRGWGLFLIEKLVDEARTTQDEDGHTLELVMRLEVGDGDGPA